jgi:hypothetical protein
MLEAHEKMDVSLFVKLSLKFSKIKYYPWFSRCFMQLNGQVDLEDLIGTPNNFKYS